MMVERPRPAPPLQWECGPFPPRRSSPLGDPGALARTKEENEVYKDYRLQRWAPRAARAAWVGLGTPTPPFRRGGTEGRG